MCGEKDSPSPPTTMRSGGMISGGGGDGRFAWKLGIAWGLRSCGDGEREEFWQLATWLGFEGGNCLKTKEVRWCKDEANIWSC